MRNNSKKILIIVIIIIAVLAIVGTTLAYLMIATDAFKSNQELFVKYISQNIDSIDKMKNSNINNTYSNLDNENAYESNTDVKIRYSEGGEVSNPFNDLSIKTVKQVDSQNEYIYRDAQVLFKDEEYLELELIRENDISGIRFSDVVKQFIGVKNNENLIDIAEDLNIEVSDLEDFVSYINGEETLSNQIMTKEELNIIKETYSKIIKENMANATYSKIKKAMITVNNRTIQTNSYTATLNSDQVQNLMLQILNTLKNDSIILRKIDAITGKELLDATESDNMAIGMNNAGPYTQFIDNLIEKINDYEKDFPEIKITVYERNGITVRTTLEMGANQISLENSEENGQLKTRIQIKKVNSEKEDETTIEITKNSNESTETYNINTYIVDGEETNQILVTIQMQKNSNEINLNTEVKLVHGIEEITLTIENVVDIGEISEKKQTLEENNNIVLNDLDEEGRRRIIATLDENVPQKFSTRIALLIQALGLENEVDTPQESGNGEYEMTQTEINRFNAKFEFYTGESVSAQNVNSLLDVVKSNLASVQIINNNIDNEDENNSQDVMKPIQLNIEKDQENEELVRTIAENIKEGKTYNVSIRYKELNNMIESILISEVK